MKVFEGLKIVGLVTNLPGPLVLLRLAQMGAQCIKIEPAHGDVLARTYPKFYEVLSEKQKIIRMNLGDTDGLKQILSDADLLVTTMRNKTLNKLGLDWDSLHLKFPKLSQLVISGFGKDEGDRPGHDLSYQAVKGFIRPNEFPITCWADLAGAQEAIIAAMELVMAKSKGSVEQREVSLSDALDFFALPFDHGLTSPGGPLSGSLGLYQVYQCQKGRIALALLEPHFISRFQEVLGVSNLSQENLSQVFATKSAVQWNEWAKEHDLPIVEVKETRRSDL